MKAQDVFTEGYMVAYCPKKDCEGQRFEVLMSMDGDGKIYLRCRACGRVVEEINIITDCKQGE